MHDSGALLTAGLIAVGMAGLWVLRRAEMLILPSPVLGAPLLRATRDDVRVRAGLGLALVAAGAVAGLTGGGVQVAWPVTPALLTVATLLAAETCAWRVWPAGWKQRRLTVPKAPLWSAVRCTSATAVTAAVVAGMHGHGDQAWLSLVAMSTTASAWAWQVAAMSDIACRKIPFEVSTFALGASWLAMALAGGLAGVTAVSVGVVFVAVLLALRNYGIGEGDLLMLASAASMGWWGGMRLVIWGLLLGCLVQIPAHLIARVRTGPAEAGHGWKRLPFGPGLALGLIVATTVIGHTGIDSCAELGPLLNTHACSSLVGGDR